MSVIDCFKNNYYFLSNFSYYGFFNKKGLYYPTVEHYFQAMKTEDKEERTKIRTCLTPNEAKKLGRKAKLRNNWEDIRIKVMKQGLRYKFWQNAYIRVLLMETAGKQLIEGNKWNDTFWGVCNGKGENNLGRLLMLLRDEYLELDKTFNIKEDYYHIFFDNKDITHKDHKKIFGLFNQTPFYRDLQSNIYSIKKKYENRLKNSEMREELSRFGYELVIGRPID